MDKKIIDMMADENRILGYDRYVHFSIFICMCTIKGEEYFVLEKRSANIRQGGEISFPGGKIEKNDKDPRCAAIRETSEELCLCPNKIEVIGKLGILVNPSRMILHCYYGNLLLNDPYEITPQESEVEKLIFVPVKEFLYKEPMIKKAKIANIPDETFREITIPKKYYEMWEGRSRNMYFYNYDNIVIWGITGEIIYEFIKIYKSFLGMIS